MGAQGFAKMKLLLLAFACAVSYFHIEANLDIQNQILSDFKAKYNNSKSDLIFLLDTSGSVGTHNFKSEKDFVNSLLNEFSLAPYSTRVAVITFGKVVKTDINYIDIEGTELDKNKCKFKPKFQNQVPFRNGARTDMKAGFSEVINLLRETKLNNRKRNGVHTVAMMITDGWWNTESPYDNTDTLKSTYLVDIFAVGVGYYDLRQLNRIASSPQHVLEFSSFRDFKTLAMRIRGGELKYIKEKVLSYDRVDAKKKRPG